MEAVLCRIIFLWINSDCVLPVHPTMHPCFCTMKEQSWSSLSFISSDLSACQRDCAQEQLLSVLFSNLKQSTLINDEIFECPVTIWCIKIKVKVSSSCKGVGNFYSRTPQEQCHRYNTICKAEHNLDRNCWESETVLNQTRPKNPNDLLYSEEVLFEIQSWRLAQDSSLGILTIKNTSIELLPLFWKSAVFPVIWGKRHESFKSVRFWTKMLFLLSLVSSSTLLTL